MSINNDLQNNIFEYLFQFSVVGMPQIKRMFRQYSPEAIEWHVNTMLFERYIGRSEEIDKETGTESIDSAVFFVRKSFQTNKEVQRYLTLAASVLAEFGSDNVRYYQCMEFPVQVFFITADKTLYDVTVIDPGAVNQTVQAAFRFFQTSTPPNMTDMTEHIAVVFNESDAKTVGKTGIFDYYVVINSKTSDIQIKPYD